MNEFRLKGKTGRWAMGFAVSVALAIGGGCGPSKDSRSPATPSTPLQYGWKFACAIENSAVDLSDRSKCQEKIALAYLAAGDVETARSLGRQIGDWRKGMVLAKVIERQLKRGETAKAEALLPELVSCGLAATDWQRDWLSVAVIRTHALMGRIDEVRQGVGRFARHPNLGGDAVTSLALLLARTGRVDEAKSMLNDLGKEDNADVAVSRTQGYLDLVAFGRLDRNMTTQLLVNAWEAAGRVAPYQRWELQIQVIDAMATNGLAAEVRERLAGVSSNIVAAAAKLPPEIQASMLSHGAILWSRLGEPKKGEELLGEAEKAIGRSPEIVFQPSAYADVADAYAAAGDMAQARALYTRALDIAAALVNPRPRAMAGVDVCVSLTGHKEVIDAGIQKGLDRLLATFHATQP